MAFEMGIFETEQQAIDAIQALEAEGFSNHAIKVFAKDREHSRRVEAETNVHADELLELTDTREHMDDHGFGGIVGTAAGMVAGNYMASTPSGVVAGQVYGAPFLGRSLLFGDDDSNVESALRDIGLDSDTAAICRGAIADGAIIVAADIGNASGNDGPNLTTAGSAEAIFRRLGARSII